ncbi:uncharacterized protein LOC132258311 [Phlebotomus argentipes]|uniref:uncharacterized protein LOC132258311 n=1 Tax=Phlebotomus argentipes TaxID=94469 RepID=UPI0028937B21|nr:uncharacterized protein LOC132258311 [Phlebotomus argentipes]
MEPQDLATANLIINELRSKCRLQAEQILAWKKAYTYEVEVNCRSKKARNDQINILTSQLILLESRLIKKQKQISNLLCQREQTIHRQQKFIDSLCSQLSEHGLDIPDACYMNLDSLNDSDSAVVLDDIDSDCNSSIIMKRKPYPSDVTVVRSISDAIETNLKYSSGRRSNCYLKRPDILETVYSVEEDSEPNQAPTNNVSEKRDKFKSRSEKIIGADDENNAESIHANVDNFNNNCNTGATAGKPSPVVNYNRVMLNHRSITRPKDVKYKRINKAKSKSLEELRDKLKHWIDRGTSGEHFHHHCPESTGSQSYA